MWFQGHICRFFACFLLFGTTTPRYAVSSVWGLSCRPIGAISLFQASFFNPPIALGGSVFESAKKLCSAFGVILWWLLLYMEWVKNATIKSSIGAPEVVRHDLKHEDFFYRATGMHSADYAVARCLSIRLSVCHTPVLSLNGYTYPQKFFIIG